MAHIGEEVGLVTVGVLGGLPGLDEHAVLPLHAPGMEADRSRNQQADQEDAPGPDQRFCRQELRWRHLEMQRHRRVLADMHQCGYVLRFRRQPANPPLQGGRDLLRGVDIGRRGVELFAIGERDGDGFQLCERPDLMPAFDQPLEIDDEEGVAAGNAGIGAEQGGFAGALCDQENAGPLGEPPIGDRDLRREAQEGCQVGRMLEGLVEGGRDASGETDGLGELALELDDRVGTVLCIVRHPAGRDAEAADKVTFLQRALEQVELEGLDLIGSGVEGVDAGQCAGKGEGIPADGVGAAIGFGAEIFIALAPVAQQLMGTEGEGSQYAKQNDDPSHPFHCRGGAPRSDGFNSPFQPHTMGHKAHRPVSLLVKTELIEG